MSTLSAIRGAITVSENSKEQIFEATDVLLRRILKRNEIHASDVISLIFSQTADLSAAYPALAARAGFADAGIMCVSEMGIDNSLPMCIRVLLYAYTDVPQSEISHVYLRGAEVLRPDRAFNSIALDGPCGSGKSTVAKILSQKLGWVYIDTGAMYRTIGLYALRSGVSPAAADTLLHSADIEIKYTDGTQRIFLNGEDVSETIRTQEVADSASQVAALPLVREHLVTLQKKMAKSANVIMDGRDIGTRVLPNATLKIFMDASVAVRAKRRANELAQKGGAATLEEVTLEVAERDYRDFTRTASPLRRAEDAIALDTSALDAEEVSEKILELLKERD
ncbi:hypothetical protein AGMMS49975_26440 [Clostridia bacterium]|nr:hypothetical protein AGMMS49975_26440 [Clostridia bacterium]